VFFQKEILLVWQYLYFYLKDQLQTKILKAWCVLLALSILLSTLMGKWTLWQTKEAVLSFSLTGLHFLVLIYTSFQSLYFYNRDLHTQSLDYLENFEFTQVDYIFSRHLSFLILISMFISLSTAIHGYLFELSFLRNLQMIFVINLFLLLQATWFSWIHILMNKWLSVPLTLVCSWILLYISYIIYPLIYESWAFNEVIGQRFLKFFALLLPPFEKMSPFQAIIENEGPPLHWLQNEMLNYWRMAVDCILLGWLIKFIFKKNKKG
jgi:hypothetical protein